MAKVITDLHGNNYQLGDFKLKVNFPELTFISIVFNKDTVNGHTFTLAKTKNHTYVIYYNVHLDMYIMYKATEVKYNILKDIRKSYLHGNQHHS